MLTHSGYVRGYFNVGKSTFCQRVSELNDDYAKHNHVAGSIDSGHDGDISGAHQPSTWWVGSTSEVHKVDIKLSDNRLALFSKDPASTKLLKLNSEYGGVNATMPTIHLSIIDTGGFDRTDSVLPRSYGRDIDFIILLFSCDSKTSLTFMMEVLKQLEEEEGGNGPRKYIVCNKIDLFRTDVVRPGKYPLYVEYNKMKEKTIAHLECGLFYKRGGNNIAPVEDQYNQTLSELDELMQSRSDVCNQIFYISAIQALGLNELVFTVLDEALERRVGLDSDPFMDHSEDMFIKQHVIKYPTPKYQDGTDGGNMVSNKKGIIKSRGNRDPELQKTNTRGNSGNHSGVQRLGDKGSKEEGNDCCL